MRISLHQARAAVDTEPTESQIEVGNYAKGHVRVHGLDISIESQKGSLRSGVGADGKPWARNMRHDYGYIKGTEGADGDHVDVFLGPHLDSELVFVVDQVSASGRFDEHKVVLGAQSEDEARDVYSSNYPAGWRIGPIATLTVEQFKKWLADGDTTSRAVPQLRFMVLAKSSGSIKGSGKNRLQMDSLGRPHWRRHTGDSYAEIEREAMRGTLAMEHVMQAHDDVWNAMTRPVLGSIAFLWGKPGRLTTTGLRYVGGEGVSKIIAQRNHEGDSGELIARRIPRVIAFGRVVAVQGEGTPGERVLISLGGITAVLSLYRFGQRRTWLLTGWREDDTAGVNPNRAYAPADPGISPQGGAPSERIMRMNAHLVNIHSPMTKAEQLALFTDGPISRNPRNRLGLDRIGRPHWVAPPEAPAMPQPARTVPPLVLTPPPRTAGLGGRADCIYKDVGYVSGSRKELAASQLRLAKKEGRKVHWQDVDFVELEKSPRVAAEVITKGHVFGDVDWSALEAAGMSPSAGYLVRAVYASVGVAPDIDAVAKGQGLIAEPNYVTIHGARMIELGTDEASARRAMQAMTTHPSAPALPPAVAAQSRVDYVRAINTLRERMERCRTHDDVLKELAEIRDERVGGVLNAPEADTLSGYQKQLEEVQGLLKEHRSTHRALGSAEYEAEIAAKAAKTQADKERLRVLWRKAQLATQAWVHGHVAYYDGLEALQSKLLAAQSALRSAAGKRNAAENEMTRGWRTLGEKFARVLNYRHGDNAFQRAVIAVKLDKVTDWSWAKKERKKGEKSPDEQVSKKSERFQLLVADHFDRIGGRTATVGSSAELRARFGLRAVQSGLWVLSDYASGKFHMQQCSQALADLADVLGIKDEDVSFRGRLAVAFGARGNGPAKAHYEAVERVINMTKMAGAGSLAHEWFHALDNILLAAYGVDDAHAFGSHAGSRNTALPSPLRDAFNRLHRAMTEGKFLSRQEVEIDDKDDRMADINLTKERSSGHLSFGRPNWRHVIVSAASPDAAMQGLAEMRERGLFGHGRRGDKQFAAVQRIAAAYWTKDQKGKTRKVAIFSGEGRSRYLVEAMRLNSGSPVAGKPGYWSQPHELAARAFAQYVEGKLARMGRKNEYLSYKSSNDAYGARQYPYPEGDERVAIEAAFDNLIAVMHAEDAFHKAASVLPERRPSKRRATLPRRRQLLTEQASIDKDLVYLDEDDWPAASPSLQPALTERRAHLKHRRHEIASQLEGMDAQEN